jgi:ribose transport system substrate-binding protein
MKQMLVILLTLLTAAPALLAQKTYNLAVIPKGTTHEFWKSIHAGAIKAHLEGPAAGG